MSATMEDYNKAIEDFARDLNPFGDDLISAYLFGSVARGNIKPGKSDLDLYVFLRQNILKDRERFLKALDTMTNACRNLARSGVPYGHPFTYYCEDELRYMPEPYLPVLLSENESRLITGQDIRARFDTPFHYENGLQTWISFVYPFARFLGQEELTSQECNEVAFAMEFIRKFALSTACAAAGEPAVGEDILPVLMRHFPDVDLSVIDDLETLGKAGDELPGSEEIKKILRKGLVLVEELQRRIVARRSMERNIEENGGR